MAIKKSIVEPDLLINSAPLTKEIEDAILTFINSAKSKKTVKSSVLKKKMKKTV